MKKLHMCVLIIVLIVLINSCLTKTDMEFSDGIIYMGKIEQARGRVIYSNGKGDIWNWGKYSTNGESANSNWSRPIKVDKIQSVIDFVIFDNEIPKPPTAIFLNDKGELYQENVNEDMIVSVEKYTKVDGVKRILTATSVPPSFLTDKYLCVEKNDGSLWKICIKNSKLENKLEKLILPNNFGKLKQIGKFGTLLNENGEVWERVFNDENDLYKKIDISDVKEIQSDFNVFLALKEDGTVWGWGNNNTGVLSPDNYSNGIIASESFESFAEKNDVFVDEPIQIQGLENIEQIFFGSTAYALNKRGEVFYWGLINSFDDEVFAYLTKIFRGDYVKMEEQESLNLETIQFPPKILDTPRNGKVRYVCSNYIFTALIMDNDKLFCRGLNFDEQAGMGDTLGSSQFVEVEFE